MKLARLIEMCLNKTYGRVRLGKHLSNMFHIKNDLKEGDALSQLLFNFASDYGVKKVQAIQDGLQLNGAHRLKVCAADVSILGGGVHTVKGNRESLVVGSKETGLEGNSDKTKYMVMS